MKRILKWLGLALLLVVAYLLAWPVPLKPVAWRAPQFDGYAGPYSKNDRLAAMRLISVAPEIGPEHIAFGPDGKLYTGVLSGAVLRMNPDGTGVETVVNTGGRPLGMDFDAGGNLVVADAMKGLLAVGKDGSVKVLADHVGASPVLYADAVVVMSNGRMLFTDASQRFSPVELGTFDAALLDIMEHSCTGRVLEFDPATGQSRVVIGGLCFPNGVALSGDQSHFFIAETGEYRVWKVDVNASNLDARVVANDPANMQARVILANLPGFPDNLTRGADGRLWTGLTKPRAKAIDDMSGKPFLRAISLRLPKSLWPVPPAYGHVIAFDEDGKVVADLQDPGGRLPETSGATEYQGDLYIQSLHADALGVLPMSALGR
ncbi:MAG: SMP-30/gluconolactonase/LRE family protein [Gammaproteobacteria bacterium]|nr:SMP-30/gluconolactonase/LRE family protein [Gammaproteobacteria bacterium]